jgi:hypothetical protein
MSRIRKREFQQTKLKTNSKPEFPNVKNSISGLLDRYRHFFIWSFEFEVFDYCFVFRT